MANFAEHISQAKRNLLFLESINKQSNNFWDWQVTTCFYTSVHLINAHIANFDLHYRSHEQVNEAINPFGISPCKLDEETYLSYLKLQHLSRRSRYLIHDDPKNKSKYEHITYDKHFKKAVYHLDKILQFIVDEYSISFSSIKITCAELKGRKDLKYFNCN